MGAVQLVLTGPTASKDRSRAGHVGNTEPEPEPEPLPYGCVTWSHDALAAQDESVWRTAALQIMTSFIFMKRSPEKC